MYCMYALFTGTILYSLVNIRFDSFLTLEHSSYTELKLFRAAVPLPGTWWSQRAGLRSYNNLPLCRQTATWSSACNVSQPTTTHSSVAPSVSRICFDSISLTHSQGQTQVLHQVRDGYHFTLPTSVCVSYTHIHTVCLEKQPWSRKENHFFLHIFQD